MASEKSSVECYIDITRSNYERHFKFQCHLKNTNIKLKEFNELRVWVNYNNIFNYEKLTKDRLKEIKKTLNSRKNYYNLFNKKKFEEIANELSIRNLGNLNREQLINRLNKISSNHLDQVCEFSNI